MTFEQGDIVEVNFDPTLGHEPQKKRPALVVSTNRFNDATSMTIVCPIASQTNGFFLHERLPQGLPIQGAVVMEQARAIDLEARGAEKICSLDEVTLEAILICIRSFF